VRHFLRGLVCVSLSGCPWSAAVDQYCERTGNCVDVGGGGGGSSSGVGGGTGIGGGDSGGGAQGGGVGGGADVGGGGTGGAIGGGTTAGGGATGGGAAGGGAGGGAAMGGGAAGGGMGGSGGGSVPPAALALLNPTLHILAGQCVQYTVQVQSSGGAPVSVAADLSVSLGQAPLQFFSDSKCSQSEMSLKVTTGQSQATFWLSAKSGGTYMLTANAAGLTGATAQLVVNPLVRRLSDTFGNGAGSVSLALTPTLLSTNALVFVQVNTVWPDSASPRIQCVLNGTTSVDCSRGHTGSVVNFEVQVFEHRALTVQQASYNCGASAAYVTPTLMLQTPVNPSETFLTSTVKLANSPGFGGNDLVALRLIDSTTLGLEMLCTDEKSVAIQVASFSGINVRRSAVMPFLGLSQLTPLLGAVDGGAFVGYSWSTNSAALLDECSVLVRADITVGNIIFSRGLLNMACGQDSLTRLDWELVDFGPWASSQKVMTMVASQDNVAAMFPTPVDPSATLVLTGNNTGLLGGGEDDQGAHTPGPTAGLSIQDLSNMAPTSSINISRSGAGVHNARWTTWVVTFQP
jgi:hypothetical protein